MVTLSLGAKFELCRLLISLHKFFWYFNLVSLFCMTKLDFLLMVLLDKLNSEFVKFSFDFVYSFISLIELLIYAFSRLRNFYSIITWTFNSFPHYQILELLNRLTYVVWD